MPHARAQIRQALVTRLTGLGSTGARVSANRVHVFESLDLPALRVYAESEDKQDELMGGRQQRRVTFTIEALAKQNSALEDTLDQIALEVETAIAIDQTLGGLCKGGLRYDGIGDFRIDDDTDQPVGVWPLRFTAEYDVDAANPAVIT